MLLYQVDLKIVAQRIVKYVTNDLVFWPDISRRSLRNKIKENIPKFNEPMKNSLW